MIANGTARSASKRTKGRKRSVKRTNIGESVNYCNRTVTVTGLLSCQSEVVLSPLKRTCVVDAGHRWPNILLQDNYFVSTRNAYVTITAAVHSLVPVTVKSVLILLLGMAILVIVEYA